MSNSDLSFLLSVLLLLGGLAQSAGLQLSPRRQPKVVGEILAGIVLSPAVLGHVPGAPL